MTIREHLNYRKRRFMVFHFLGAGCFLTGITWVMVASKGVIGRNQAPIDVHPAAVALLILAALLTSGTHVSAMLWAFRCPSCFGSLAPLMMNQYRFSRHVVFRFCPYCGRSLDEEMA